MAALPQFLISTQTDPYWEIPFFDANGNPLSVEGRVFEAWIAPSTSKTGVGEPVAPIKVLTFQDGLSLVAPTDGSGDQTVKNTFVHQVSRAFAQANFPRGELTADILEVVDGARRLLVPVRLRYDDPAAIRDFVADRAGVTFGAGRQPIVTPVAVAGQAGRRGTGILTGALPPQPSDGEDGDYWIVDRSANGQSNVIYGPKEDGEWPAQPSSALGVGGVADVPGLPSVLGDKADLDGINAPGTMAAFLASTLPALQRVIQIGGYFTPGGGGAHLRIRIAAPPAPKPWQCQIADGSWWEISGDDIDVRALGAVGGAKDIPVSLLPNDYVALQAALDFIGITGGRINVPGHLQFRTDSQLFARINRQLPPAATGVDIHFSPNSRMDLVSTGGGVIVAGKAMKSLLTVQFNSDFGNIGPFKSKVEGFELRGNQMAQFGITSDYTMHMAIDRNCLDGFTASCINWTGYGVARITRNILRGYCGIRFQGGGGDSIIAWNDYFPTANGKCVWVGALGGNLLIDGGTYNGEGQVGSIGVDISVGGPGADEIRHVTVANAEFSGMLYGVRAIKSATARNIYALTVTGCHTIPAAGGAVNTGVLAHLTGIDTALVHHNICNGIRGSAASESAILAFDCDDLHISHNVIGNYSKPAAYFSNVRNSTFTHNKIRDVGQSGAGGVIIDIDGGTNSTQFNDNTIIQTSDTFAQNGLYERAGATANEGLRNKWQGVAVTGVVAPGSSSVFRRFSGPFSEGTAFQNATTASASGGRNLSVVRASVGRCNVIFFSPHPDANYTAKVVGVGCKVEVESKTANGFTVLMLDLGNNPLDAAFDVEVTSRAA
jgi:hypothetical protein